MDVGNEIRNGDWMVVVCITTLFIGVAWGVLNIWAFHEKGIIVNMYIDTSILMLIGLAFSLLIESGVTV